MGIGRSSILRRGALWAGVLAVLAGCARFIGQEPTPQGPGVPRLLTARFEPDRIRVGEETTLVLTFEDSDGDLAEVVLVEQTISDFRFISSTNVLSRNLRRHRGEVVGTAREVFRWDAPTIRYYDVYLLDLKGNASNRIPVRVTVR